MQCYYTDINTVEKANYGKPVTLTFKNMAAKIRVALYETVPGYSVKDVKFYTSDANPTAPTDLGTGTSTTATLFTMGDDVLPQSGTVTVFYPRIGTTHRNNTQDQDYNKASVTVTPGGATSTTQAFRCSYQPIILIKKLTSLQATSTLAERFQKLHSQVHLLTISTQQLFLTQTASL